MNSERFEYLALQAPFAIAEGHHENQNIKTPEEWVALLNQHGTDGWEWFRYEYGYWFFKRRLK